MNRIWPLLSVFAFTYLAALGPLSAADLRAGAARVEITDRAAGPVNDPLYAKALVLKDDKTTLALITVDAVAIGEIGRIESGFMPIVRTQLKKELGIPPNNILVNASHCHGIVRADTPALVVQAVREAFAKLEPVTAAAGETREDRISENRRLLMKDGSETDMRRAYALPRDEDVAEVGPIDPQVGLLRLDRMDGSTLALLYNFACHPIESVPSGGNTADYPAFASEVIEEGFGKGALAIFVQGCGGDINPIRYKDVMAPHNAVALGHQLGVTALRAAKQLAPKQDAKLSIVREVVKIPRGADYEQRIAKIQAEQVRLLASLKPTNINFKTFLPLLIQQKASPGTPGFYGQGYLHEKSMGRDDQVKLDVENSAGVSAYLQNIDTMEQLTRLNTNLALLKKHLAQTEAAGGAPLEVDVMGLRVGDFRLVTFPGELTVRVGLTLKAKAPAPLCFVAGYTNGYIYYTATAEQRRNVGFAQEDCDTMVAPEWQAVFEAKALEILRRL